MDKPHFEPWVGKQYGATSKFGQSVMILGESHYLGGRAVDSPDLTNLVIGQVARNEDKHWDRRLAFFAKVFRVFEGKTRSQASVDEWKEFWHSILYYNYVQTPLANARQRPSSKMWQEGDGAFRHVVGKYQPDRILILGSAIWGHVHAARLVCSVSPANHQHCAVQWEGRPPVPVAAVYHPSSFHFRHEVSAEVVARLLAPAPSDSVT